jgi:transmembrane sensor
VARLPERTTVTLLEGRVDVRSLDGGAVETLAPGQQLRIAGNGELLSKKPVEPEAATAWQRGRIVLDDLPLADALVMLNRYSPTQIVIRGTVLTTPRISGVFRIGDVQTEALVLERYFGLREGSRSAQEIILEQR